MLRTSIKVTAGILAVLGGLTACGTVQTGQAAITGDQGISTATLTNEVNNLEAAYRASNGAVQLQFPLSQAPRQVLSWLVRFRIREQMAVRNGVTVTRADIQRARATIAAQARQSQVSLVNLAVANGLPPDLLPELGRWQAIQAALLRRLDGGTLPTQQSALQALSQQFNALQCHAAKSLAIKVNPQFGRLDYGQLSVIPAESGLSAPQGGEPTPSPKPQLTPQC
ncbi:MAG TPA: SurA N-terminal domain-containing protein [Streptosporangiaceae bacterium]